jgi:hypothetical protein
MKNLIEAAAEKFGVPSEVLDLLDRNWISEVIEEFPSLLLPPIMQTLHQEYVKHGMEWVSQNITELRNRIQLLQKLYGPTWILAGQGTYMVFPLTGHLI